MLNVSFKLLLCRINYCFLGSESLQKDHHRALFDWWFVMKRLDDFNKSISYDSSLQKNWHEIITFSAPFCFVPVLNYGTAGYN